MRCCQISRRYILQSEVFVNQEREWKVHLQPASFIEKALLGWEPKCKCSFNHVEESCEKPDNTGEVPTVREKK